MIMGSRMCCSIDIRCPSRILLLTGHLFCSHIHRHLLYLYCGCSSVRLDDALYNTVP